VLLITKISGEKEEHPPPVAVSVVQDSTLTLAPLIKVLVESKEESDLLPTGTSSI